jgi:hypothetical protein
MAEKTRYQNLIGRVFGDRGKNWKMGWKNRQGSRRIQRLVCLPSVWTMKKPNEISEDAISWMVMGLVLIAAIIFDRRGMPQRWHAAIMWTVVAFGPVTMTRRKRWGSASFWGKWTIYLSLHMLLMRVVFAYLLANVKVVGTLYAVPFGAIETFVLLALLSKRQVRHRLPPNASARS